MSGRSAALLAEAERYGFLVDPDRCDWFEVRVALTVLRGLNDYERTETVADLNDGIPLGIAGTTAAAEWRVE